MTLCESFVSYLNVWQPHSLEFPALCFDVHLNTTVKLRTLEDGAPFCFSSIFMYFIFSIIIVVQRFYLFSCMVLIHCFPFFFSPVGLSQH